MSVYINHSAAPSNVTKTGKFVDVEVDVKVIVVVFWGEGPQGH